MFIILGILFGVMGYIFNWGLFKVLDWFDCLLFLVIKWKGFLFGFIIGILFLFFLFFIDGGDNVVFWVFNS